MDTLIGIVLWGLIGAIPGFYVSYLRGYNPRDGILVGAIIGIVVGVVGLSTGIVAAQGSAVVIIFGLAAIAALFLPKSDYLETKTSIQRRVSLLAYLLILPTALIVLGVVIFPLVWNLIFSFRPIEMADLRDVQLFDLSDATLDNYQSQLGLRIDAVPCAVEEDGSTCTLDEDGNTEYMRARDVLGDYRGWREIGALDLGGEHYTIGARNRDFYPMIIRTFTYTIISSLMAIGLGLIAALIANDAFRGRNIFRSFLLFPYIAPVISVAFVWQVLLRQDGIVNELLGTQIPFLNTNETWFGVSVPLIFVIFFQAWRYFPFAFLFLLARIQAIPSDMYEAAQVDGATPSERLWFITLPQLRAVFGTLLLLRFIWTFNKFDDIFLLTGTNPDTKVLPVGIFEALFAENDVGKASSIAVVMAAILGVVLFFYFRYFLVDEE